MLPWTREVCSLLAGHVGNMDGSMGRGDSLKYSCFNASSAVVRRSGLYVRNLKQPSKHVNMSVLWTGGWWPRIEDSGGGSSTGRQRRVATLTPEIRETRKRESVIARGQLWCVGVRPGHRVRRKKILLGGHSMLQISLASRLFSPFPRLPKKVKKKVCFYIVQYTRYTLHPPGSPIHSDTNSTSLGSILAMQQLHAKTNHSHFHHCL